MAASSGGGGGGGDSWKFLPRDDQATPFRIKGTSWRLRTAKVGMIKNGKPLERNHVFSVGDVKVCALCFVAFPEGTFFFKKETFTAVGAVLPADDGSTFFDELVVVDLDYVYADTKVTNLSAPAQHFCGLAKDYLAKLCHAALEFYEVDGERRARMDGAWLAAALNKTKEVEGNV